jgi:hypothetical protein
MARPQWADADLGLRRCKKEEREQSNPAGKVSPRRSFHDRVPLTTIDAKIAHSKLPINSWSTLVLRFDFDNASYARGHSKPYDSIKRQANQRDITPWCRATVIPR